MIITFFFIVFFTFSTLFILFIYKPLLVGLKLKLKYGSAVYVFWWPSLSEFSRLNKAKQLTGDSFSQYKKIIADNPKIKFVVTNILDKPYIHIIAPEYTKQFLLNHDYYRKYDLLGYDGLTHKGMHWQLGQKWRHTRNILGEAFTFDKLKSRIPIMNQVIFEQLSNFTQDRLLDLTTSISGEVVIRSFISLTSEEMKVDGKMAKMELAQLIGEFASLKKENPLILLKQAILGYKSWSYFVTSKERALVKRAERIKAVIQSKIEDRINGKIPISDDFLQSYIQELQKNTDITIEEIVQQFIMIFFAGTDTSANTTFIAMYFIAKHEQLYQWLIEEIDQQDEFSSSTINKFKRLSSFISEVLRVSSPVVGIVPRIASESHYLNDLKVEKGSIMNIFINMTQLSDANYANASEFDYKRFMNSNPVINDNGFVNIPFSGGPRNCIGQHMGIMVVKAMLFNILKSYRVILNEQIPTVWDIKFMYSITPQNCITLIKRSDQAQQSYN